MEKNEEETGREKYQEFIAIEGNKKCMDLFQKDIEKLFPNVNFEKDLSFYIVGLDKITLISHLDPNIHRKIHAMLIERFPSL